MITCGSRKYPYSPHGRSLELLGGGDLKANNLEAKYEAKLEFLRVRRVQNKTPSWGGGKHGYFRELHTHLWVQA